jgi:hypothetical protein
MALQPLWALVAFQFLDLFTDGRTPWTSDQLVARPLPKHRITNIHTKHPCPEWDSTPWSQRPSYRAQLLSMHFLKISLSHILFFLICIVGVESKLGPLGTSATYWPIVPAPGDCEDGEFGEINGRGNRSTRRKPAPPPFCSPQIPLDQTRD